MCYFEKIAKIIILKMKKSTKNLIGLIITGFLYYSIVLPLIMGENIRLPINGEMFGAMLVWVIGFPLLSFLIPGIIALVVYMIKKTFWSNFYYTGWAIFILILVFNALGTH
jgi:hypothetical protein